MRMKTPFIDYFASSVRRSLGTAPCGGNLIKNVMRMTHIRQMSKPIMKFFLAITVCFFVVPAWAQEHVVLAGAEASRDSRYAYLGVLLPLPGQQLGNGFVQRYWLDYIGYQYDKTQQQEIEAKVTGGEAALGYQQSNASSWWGMYIGARYANTRLSPYDPLNEDRGGRLRAKLQFEGETEIREDWRINGIASHLIGSSNYFARLRLQTNLSNQLRVGPEVIVQGDSNYRAYKVGAFLGNIMFATSTALTLKLGMSKLESAPASLYAGAEFYIPF